MPKRRSPTVKKTAGCILSLLCGAGLMFVASGPDVPSTTQVASVAPMTGGKDPEAYVPFLTTTTLAPQAPPAAAPTPRQRQTTRTPTSAPPRRPAARSAAPTPRASGGTPPEYVKQCESGGDYRAINPNGHYGAWQFSQSTWEAVGGTGRPDQASPAEQDRRAAILWNGGSGAGHWSCARARRR